MKPITSLYQKDQKKELYKVWGLINLSATLCSGNRLTYSRKHVCVAGTKKVKVLTTGLLIARCNVLHWFVLFSIANKDHSSVVYFILFFSLPRLHRSELMKQKLLCYRYFSVSLEVHIQYMARKSRCSVSNSCYSLPFSTFSPNWFFPSSFSADSSSPLTLCPIDLDSLCSLLFFRMFFYVNDRNRWPMLDNFIV